LAAPAAADAEPAGAHRARADGHRRRPPPPARRYLKLLREIADTNSFFYAGHGYELTNSLQRFDAAACAAAAAAAGGAAGASSATAAAVAAVPLPPPPAAGAAALQSPAVGAAVALAAGGGGRSVDPATCDERFFWNKRALAAVLAAGPAARGFVTPVINGLVLSSPCTVAGVEVDLLLISRRACTRQGTRFNMRGADEAGGVANYAETEQLVLAADGAVSSFVQVRGSVPLLWEQPACLKYAPRAVLRGAEPAQRAAFGRHMRAQLAKYGAVTAVNLIDKKKDQKMLGDAYAAAAAAFASPALRYVWFDFHDECKKMRWENLRKLVDIVAGDVAAYGCVCARRAGEAGPRNAGAAIFFPPTVSPSLPHSHTPCSLPRQRLRQRPARRGDVGAARRAAHQLHGQPGPHQRRAVAVCAARGAAGRAGRLGAGVRGVGADVAARRL
jgi:hypothetical protein